MCANGGIESLWSQKLSPRSAHDLLGLSLGGQFGGDFGWPAYLCGHCGVDARCPLWLLRCGFSYCFHVCSCFSLEHLPLLCFSLSMWLLLSRLLGGVKQPAQQQIQAHCSPWKGIGISDHLVPPSFLCLSPCKRAQNAEFPCLRST